MTTDLERSTRTYRWIMFGVIVLFWALAVLVMLLWVSMAHAEDREEDPYKQAQQCLASMYTGIRQIQSIGYFQCFCNKECEKILLDHGVQSVLIGKWLEIRREQQNEKCKECKKECCGGSQ